MCRPLLVVCVAPDRASLLALKRAAVGTEWELAEGATSAEEALAQIEDGRAHVLVTLGPFRDLVLRARASCPWIRVVAVGPMPEADVAVPSLEEVRGAILGTPRPGGPVRS